MLRSGDWFPPAAAALLLWGLWGLLQKLATNAMPPRQVYIFAAIGSVLAAAAVVAATGIQSGLPARGIMFAIFAGLCSSIGGLLFVYAVSRGTASVVITLTSLYPLVTIVLSFFVLRETITLPQGIGIVLAFASMFLMSR